MKLSRFEKWANKGVMNMGEYSEYAKYMQFSINMLSNFCDNVPTDEIPPYLIFDENVSRETFYYKLYETYQKLRDIRDWGGKHSQDESDFNNIITDGIKANFKNFDTMKAFFVGKARDWYNTDLQKAIEKRIGI